MNVEHLAINWRLIEEDLHRDKFIEACSYMLRIIAHNVMHSRQVSSMELRTQFQVLDEIPEVAKTPLIYTPECIRTLYISASDVRFGDARVKKLLEEKATKLLMS